jgi:hypothetical protein
MKFLYTFILSILLTATAIAQDMAKTTVVKDTAYVAAYHKLRALYVKQLDSDVHKNSEKLLATFINKAKFNSDKGVLSEKEGMINWIRANFDKTRFSSIEEAEKVYNEMVAARAADMAENADYYTFIQMCIKKHSTQILLDVMQNKDPEDKDPNEDPVYVATRDKLKALYSKYEKSESHRALNGLNQEFRKKANFNSKIHKLATGEDMLDWVKKNLATTGFTSLNQAEMEWGAIEFAEAKDQKENADYYTLSRETLQKYGYEMEMEIMMDFYGEE